MRIRNNQSGAMDALMLPLMVSVVLTIGLAVFGVWAYFQYTSERDNTEQNIAAAVEEAKEAQAVELQAAFDEESKSPFSNFVSASAIGSVSITYPKTWSAFIDENETNTKPLEAIFHPKYVPEDDKTAYALVVQVISKDYDKEVSSFDNEAEKGEVTVKPLKVAGVTGVLIEGKIDNDYNGAMAIFAVRDKTLKLWTESTTYVKDFKETVLPNLDFEP